MSIEIIYNTNEDDFTNISEMFYKHFDPDDWDYIIIGDDHRQVDDMAFRLYSYRYDIKQVMITNTMTDWTVEKWVAVTYHG